MQFRDLKAQYMAMKDEMDLAIAEVIQNTNFINGKQVGQLERELEEFVGIKHCITCGNGTDALTLAAMALNIGEGDAVFVPDFTFFSSGEIVSFEGAVPVFVDVDEKTFNISCDHLEKVIQKTISEGKLNPKAIVAVDLFGQPANYSEIESIAKKYGLKIIEDGAQGFGGSIDGKRVGSFGDIATTSFFPAKPLGCYGDGGAVFTNDDKVAEYLRSICVHGKGSNKYDNIRIGMNSRLDTIQAAVLRVKLKAFRDYELVDVNRAAEYYTENLQGVVETPKIQENFYSSWAQYTIRLENRETRDGLQQYLKEKEIPSMIYYTKPMHKQEAFDTEVYDDKEFPVTNGLCERVLSLPLHPYMDYESQNLVIDSIKEYLKH